jgi:hypothetical protein
LVLAALVDQVVVCLVVMEATPPFRVRQQVQPQAVAVAALSARPKVEMAVPVVALDELRTLLEPELAVKVMTVDLLMIPMVPVVAVAQVALEEPVLRSPEQETVVLLLHRQLQAALKVLPVEAAVEQTSVFQAVTAAAVAAVEAVVEVMMSIR